MARLNQAAGVAATGADDRRQRGGAATRGRAHLAWDILFRVLRWSAAHARGAYTTFGIFLLAGAAVAGTLTWAFAKLAARVQSGKTQAFDDAVLRFLGAHQQTFWHDAAIELTALGTGLVVFMTVAVAALFLWLTRHRHSAVLLVVATVGGLGLNNLLKFGFDRPRPQIFAWGTHVISSSFPSGHAMNSAIVYGTVAYLAARLQRHRLSRVLTMGVAIILIVLICLSRIYLGVHYPSDVAAGVIVGLAWAAFCMAILEAAQLYARRNAPEMLRSEQPAFADEESGGSRAGIGSHASAIERRRAFQRPPKS